MKYKIMTIIFAFLLLPKLAYASVQTSLGTDNNIIINGTGNSYASLTVVLLNNNIAEESSRNNAESVIEAYKKIVSDGTIVSGEQIKYYDQIKVSKDGTYSVEVSLKGSDKGEYTVYVNNGDSSYVAYASNDYRIQLIDDMKSGKISIADAVEDNIAYISSLKDMYRNLAESEKVANFSEASIKDINTQNPEEAISELMKIINESIMAESVIEGQTTNFDTVFSYIAEIDSVQLVKDTVTADGKKQIISNLKGLDVKNIEEFRKEFQKQIVLGAINYNTNNTAERILEVITQYNDILELNLEKLLTLKSSDQALAAKRLSEAKCVSVSAVQKKLDSIVSEINNKSNVGGGGTGSGSSNGGGNKNNSFIGAGSALAGNTAIPSAADGRDSFSDLKGYEWAKSAIKKLVEYNIISGYEDLTFKPQNNITRAEFVKMVTVAFLDKKLSENNSIFSDVSNDDWYCSYIMTAYENNFVNGTGDNEFSPNANITRQDMAVILYHAAKEFGIIQDNVYEEFFDDAEISDYAKTAVYCLKSNELIKGTGNNEFVPKAYATRAEATQMLYSLIIATEKEEV